LKDQQKQPKYLQYKLLDPHNHRHKKNPSHMIHKPNIVYLRPHTERIDQHHNHYKDALKVVKKVMKMALNSADQSVHWKVFPKALQKAQYLVFHWAPM
jgi:hypothetical protein